MKTRTGQEMDSELVEMIAERVVELLGSSATQDSELIDAEEVARILGVRVDYVWALCRADQIPHQCFGRVKRFRRSAIERWMDRRERGADAASVEEAPSESVGRGRSSRSHRSPTGARVAA